MKNGVATVTNVAVLFGAVLLLGDKFFIALALVAVAVTVNLWARS